MNERIKELAEQAGFLDDLQGELLCKIQIEKFAELIVRECANIVDNVEPGYNDYRSQIEVMMRNDCVKVLLDKFGLEDDRNETRQITGDGE
jgi:hypothetical protein